MKAKGLLLAAFATCVMAALSAIACAGMSALAAALALGGLAALALVVLALAAVGGFNNMLFVFLVFHLMYGLSGPVNALYGEPLSPLFSLPYETGAFLSSFAYATVALAAAIAVGTVRPPAPLAPARASGLGSPLLLPLSIGLAAFASLLELTNLVRVGPTLVFEGKAIYQSAVDALVLTAPSYEVGKLAFCLLALGIAGRRKAILAGRRMTRIPYGKIFFLAIAPLLALSLLLGRRGPLLDWLGILFIGTTWYVSRRRVNRMIVLGGVLTYLALGMLYANRASLAYAFLVDDFSTLGEHMREPEVIVTALNPGANEFGAAFGNFSEYVKYDIDGPQFGRTYLQGLALIAPSFLYPGTKPPPVAIEFRDRFFPGLADEGAIAGTAFSSILEAYLNFRQVGVFVVYFLFGSILMALERRRRSGRSLVFALIYLSMVPATIVFHRADFGAAVIAPMFFAVVLAVIAVLLVLTLDRLVPSRSLMAGSSTAGPEHVRA